MSGAGVRAGGHGGDIGGLQDEKAGGRGTASAGRNVHNHGDGRIDDLLDNFAGRFDQASGSIDFDQHCPGILGLGFTESAPDELVRYGLNGVVEDDLQNLGGCRGQRQRQCEQCNQK